MLLPKPPQPLLPNLFTKPCPTCSFAHFLSCPSKISTSWNLPPGFSLSPLYVVDRPRIVDEHPNCSQEINQQLGHWKSLTQFLSQIYILLHLHERVDKFNPILSSLLDKHAPEVTRTVRYRPDSPWYTDELRELKQQLRTLERKAASPRALEIDRQIYKKASHHYSNQLTSAKRTYHRKQLKDCSSRELFRKVDHLLRPQSSKTSPSNDGSEISLPERFSKYFAEKVSLSLRNCSNQCSGVPSFGVDKALVGHSIALPLLCLLQTMVLVTVESFLKNLQLHNSANSDQWLEMRLQSSSLLLLQQHASSLDPIPTSFMKKCIGELLPYMTRVIKG